MVVPTHMSCKILSYWISSKMLQILIILFCFKLHLVACNDLYSKFHQKDYVIEFTRLELARYNKDVYRKFEIVTFKHNRTFAVANMTFQTIPQVISTKIEVIIQVYKFLSNEYRTFPIHFELNLCQLADHNIAGVHDVMTRCGNLKECYFQKDVVYHICNIYPNPERFPPLIPSGEYKVELTLILENLTLVTFSGYGRTSRPIKYKSHI